MTFITNPLGLLDTNNTSALALGIGGSFVGSWTQVEQFIGAVVILFLAGAEAATLAVDQSPDAGVNVTTTPYVLQATNSVSVTVQALFVRIRVLADQATTVTGYVQTIVQAGSSNPPVRPLNSTVLPTDGSIMVRTQNPSLIPCTASLYDAFGRERVSAPDPVLSYYQLTANMAARDWSEAATGAGTSSTYSQNLASTTIAVSNLTVGSRRRSSIQAGQYQAGLSALILVTVVPNGVAAGITKRWGYFNTANGLFFQTSATGLQIVLRSSTSGAPVDTVVDQSAFNGPDSIPAGFSLTNCALYGFDFEWLGVGKIRCFLIFGGQYFIIHEFANTTLLNVWMSTPNLPASYEIINNGAGPATSMQCICGTMIVERGAIGARTVPRAVNRGSSVVSVPNDGSNYVLLAVRLNPASLSVIVRPSSLNFFCTSGTVQYIWGFISKAVINGNALVWQNLSEADLQFAITDATNTVASGNLLATGYSDSTNQSNTITRVDVQQYSFGADAAGTPIIYALTARKIDGGAADTFAAALNWTEG